MKIVFSGHVKERKMKIRNGFVSNSSSSSFILLGLSPEDSDKAYDMVKKKIEAEDPYLSESNTFWRVNYYFENHGLDYCYKEDWSDNRTDGIGCILDEGDRETLEKAEDVLKKFDEEHHTDFAKNSRIFSAWEVNY